MRTRVVTIVLAASALWGCGLDSADREAMKEEIKAELRRELLQELRAELGLEVPRGRGEERGARHEAHHDAHAEASQPKRPTRGRTQTRGDTVARPRGTRPGSEPGDQAGHVAHKPSEGEPLGDATKPRDDTQVARVPSEGAVRLEIVEATMAKGVVEREPVDPGSRFEANGDRVYAFIIVRNPGPGDAHVHFVWRYRGKAVSRLRTRVGPSPRWRTWSYHRIPKGQSGPWKVEIQTDAGVILETLDFEMVPSAG